MFYVCVSDLCGFLNRYSCTCKKDRQHSQDDERVSHVGNQESTCRSWHSSLLPLCVIFLFGIIIIIIIINFQFYFLLLTLFQQVFKQDLG